MLAVSQSQIQSQTPDFTCPRCSGKGGFNCFQHVRQGVCFECWGTKQSFRLQERHLQLRLEGLRRAYRRARNAGEGRDVLSAIALRGRKARKALETFQADAQAHVESCKAQYPG